MRIVRKSLPVEPINVLVGRARDFGEEHERPALQVPRFHILIVLRDDIREDSERRRVCRQLKENAC